MKKAWKIMFALTLALVLLVGCAAPSKVFVDQEQYDIWENSGSYSLRVDTAIRTSAEKSGNIGAAVSPTPILFASVQEMRSAVLGGKFTKSQLITMQKYFSKNSMGEVILFDLNNMSDIVLPEGTELESVQFTGSGYTFSFQGDGFTGFLNLITKERLEEYDKSLNKERTTNKVVKTEEPAENVKCYYVEGASGVRKHTQYTVSSEYGTFTVCESDPIVGTDLTLCIRYWGEYNGTCFYGSIVDPSERPSPEWFQSFGLKPYVETE